MKEKNFQSKYSKKLFNLYFEIEQLKKKIQELEIQIDNIKNQRNSFQIKTKILEISISDNNIEQRLSRANLLEKLKYRLGYGEIFTEKQSNLSEIVSTKNELLKYEKNIEIITQQIENLKDELESRERNKNDLIEERQKELSKIHPFINKSVILDGILNGTYDGILDSYLVNIGISNSSDDLFEASKKDSFSLLKNLIMNIEKYSNRYNGYAEILINNFANNDSFLQLINEFKDVDFNSLSDEQQDKLFMFLGTHTENLYNITSLDDFENYESISDSIFQFIKSNPVFSEKDIPEELRAYISEELIKLDPEERLKKVILYKELGYEDKYEQSIFAGINEMSFEDFDLNSNLVLKNAFLLNKIKNSQDISEIIEYYNLMSSLSTKEKITFTVDLKKSFEDIFKSRLYIPKENNESQIVDGIQIFDAPEDFFAISKGVCKSKDSTYKESWDRLTTTFALGGGGNELVRKKTCASIINSENWCSSFDVNLGYSSNLIHNSNEFTALADRDIQSSMADGILNNSSFKGFKSLEELVSDTDNSYNEIVFDKTSLVNGKSEIVQPDYIIYYLNENFKDMDTRKNDPKWIESMTAAKEFGIPIVTVDIEKMRKKEAREIIEKIKSFDVESVKDSYRIAKKIIHYNARYGLKDLEMIPEEFKSLLNLTSNKEIKKKSIEFVKEMSLRLQKTPLKQMTSIEQKLYTKKLQELSSKPLNKLDEEGLTFIKDYYDNNLRYENGVLYKIDLRNLELGISTANPKGGIFSKFMASKIQYLKQREGKQSISPSEFSSYVPHFSGSHMRTDCDFSKCKTVGDVLLQAKKYEKVFTRYLMGEDIRFDSRGEKIDNKEVISKKGVILLAKQEDVVLESENAKNIINGLFRESQQIKSEFMDK